jgi:hypothetical protein
VLVDTNFINFSIKNKLEVVSAMMDCLLAKCTRLFMLRIRSLTSRCGCLCSRFAVVLSPKLTYVTLSLSR